MAQFAVLFGPIACIPSVERGAEINNRVIPANDGRMDSDISGRPRDGTGIVSGRKE